METTLNIDHLDTQSISEFQMTQNGILFKTLFTSSKMNVYSFKYTNLLYMHKTGCKNNGYI